MNIFYVYADKNLGKIDSNTEIWLGKFESDSCCNKELLNIARKLFPNNKFIHIELE